MRIVLSVLLSLAAVSGVSAWDRAGHMVVCAIAWDSMTDRARERSVALLRAAPSDADLATLSTDPEGLFRRAGYWADVVRDEAFPARKAAYDRPTWHYVNHFWKDGTRLRQMGTAGDLVTRLDRLDPAADAIDLAWLLHLVADVHQPLHSSGRVTEREPRGDRGGNDFLLDDLEAGNLHAFWDSILKTSRRRHHSESHDRWVERLATEITDKHPRVSLGAPNDVQSFSDWSEEGAALAMEHAYPEGLNRESPPSQRYRSVVLEVSEKQIARAGYRLAAILNRVLD